MSWPPPDDAVRRQPGTLCRWR